LQHGKSQPCAVMARWRPGARCLPLACPLPHSVLPPAAARADRQALAAAAPALLPAAGALAGGTAAFDRSSFKANGQPIRLQLAVEDRVLDLFAALRRQQLDPLALGLDLPGCWNPACSSLAGASEADMQLKRCTACKTARWAAVRVGCMMQL